MTRFDFDNLIPPTFVCDMEVYLKNLINNTDPTTYTGYSSLGKNTIKTIEFGADGLQYDVYKQFYQYRANYSDDSSKIISVLASDYTQAKALAKFLLFAKMLDRLPYFNRSAIDGIHIRVSQLGHPETWSYVNDLNIIIVTTDVPDLETYEETLLHETGHVIF